jgi:hypothetical protein
LVIKFSVISDPNPSHIHKRHHSRDHDPEVTGVSGDLLRNRVKMRRGEQFNMKINILAWGSLVWKPDTFRTAREFQPNGPPLPVEFSRISGDGRLTLVIDEVNGTPCETYTAVSAFGGLISASENLRVREGMKSTKGIGFIDMSNNTQSRTAVRRHPAAVDKIRTWIIANGECAAIWTALASNFHEPEKANKPFSVDAAIQYLRALEAKKIACALDYIRRAPSEIQTPVRQAVSELWP